MSQLRLNLLSTCALSAAILLSLIGSAEAGRSYALEFVLPQAAATALDKHGVKTSQQLVEKGATAKARAKLAKVAKVSSRKLSGWVQLCDLLRVEGVGPKLGKLLSAAGARTVKALSKKNAAKLLASIKRVNKSKKISEKEPSEAEVAAWIKDAKGLKVIYR